MNNERASMAEGSTTNASGPVVWRQEVQPTTNEPFRCRLRVTHPEGLHMRPVAALAQTAAQFHSVFVVSLGGRRADGKSPLDLMLLAAVQGAELHLEVVGIDARAGMDVLVALLTRSSWAELLGDGPVA